MPGTLAILDPELRYGTVSIGISGMTTPIGGVPFSFDVAEGVGLWIFYDEDTGDAAPATWVRAVDDMFYAGGERPFSFNLAYEGEEAGIEKLVTASVGGGSFCPDLSDEDSVLLHVIDTSADADADNDGGFDPDDPDAYTVADQWLEWAHQQYGREVPGKLGMINDGDLDYGGEGDGMPDYADGFDWFAADPSNRVSQPPTAPSNANRMKVRRPPTETSPSICLCRSRSIPTSVPIRRAVAKSRTLSKSSSPTIWVYSRAAGPA